MSVGEEPDVDIDPNKLFEAFANAPGTIAELNRIASSKTASVTADIQRNSTGGTLTGGATYEIRQVNLDNSFPVATIHTTSRGAYGLAVSRGLMHW